MANARNGLLSIGGVLILLIFSVKSYGQIILTAQKNASDVQLNWLNGSGTYDAIRSTSPTMSSETTVLASGTNSMFYLDAGAAASSTALYFYAITDAINKPNLNITFPCDTPPGGPLCNFVACNRKQDISGTIAGSNHIYVNDVWAPIVDNTFTAPEIPLNLGQNLITASAKSGSDWAIDQIIVTRNNCNQPPTITITSPADGTTIYDSTPLIIIDYNDPEGNLNLGTLHIYINGTDSTANFTIGANSAIYQFLYPVALSSGQNFIYATIQDVDGASMNASSQFIISNPIITSLVPLSGAIGASISINGNGFDLIPTNNTVMFATVQATVTAASATQLTVTVPIGAQTGPVNVTVECRTSNSLIFTVILASGFTAITSVAINNAMADSTKTPIVFTIAGTVNSLYQVRRDGTLENLGNPIASPVGLPLDFQATPSTLYFGSGPGGGLGPIWSYTPGSGLLEYIADTRVPGESSSAIYGMGNDVSGNLYILDNDNGKIKRINPNLTINVLNSDGLLYIRSNSALISQNGSLLYFTDNAYIRSIPLPNGGASTIVKAFNGPTGMANRLTAEGYLVVSRRAPSIKAISVYDPINNISWDLATGLTNPPYDVDFGTDADGPYVVAAEQSRVYRIPKPAIILTNELDQPLPTKRLVDFAPPNTECQGTNLGNNNWITLKIKFSPTTLIPTTTPRQLVTWTVEDPDDPSDDITIDPNGPEGNDNFQMLGGYDQWEADPTYPMTGNPREASVHTEIINGISQVRFHPSCSPGDNYRFKASITIPVYGTIETSSDIMTIWRKLHIESDSMGVAIGPFQEDDAVIGDIPDAKFTLFSNSFKPAYIEVVLPPDTGQNTPDVKFQYNVDTDVPKATDDQGKLGRGTTSIRGYWVLYIQGSYEGNIFKDNDPDDEINDPVLGMSAGDIDQPNRISLIFFETIRDDSNEKIYDDEYLNLYVALHEIGHQFNLGDLTGCVMNYAPWINPTFCANHIKSMRTILVPSSPFGDYSENTNK